MNSTSACLNEHFDQLHHRGDSSKASVSVGNAGHEVVDLLGLVSLLGRQVVSFIILLAVVEELGVDELLDLVGHRAHGIIGEVWARLVDVWDVR